MMSGEGRSVGRGTRGCRGHEATDEYAGSEHGACGRPGRQGQRQTHDELFLGRLRS
jgi:hypothetical protein